MTYSLLLLGHLIGLVLIGAGLIGVFVSDLRSRQVCDLRLFAEAIRYVGLFYDGLVVPGAVLLLLTGAWLTWMVWGGWNFLDIPWLAGMVGLFAFEFIEGNTVTRLYFVRVRRLTKVSLEQGGVTPELERARHRHLPTFTHFLDIPILLVIVSLGALRPDTWSQFVVGTGLAVLTATVLTITLPQLYPWVPPMFAPPSRRI
jgi:uncharacterized membrane protein